MIFNKAILTIFQRTSEDSSLSVGVFDNLLKFSKNYSNRRATLSLICAKTDDTHNTLKLVVTGDGNQYSINKTGAVEFNIFQRKNDLSFIGIQLSSEKWNLPDLNEAYHSNTTRLRLTIKNKTGKGETSYISGLIRNMNTAVSQEIHISSVQTISRSPNKYDIKLKYSIPYFPHELKVSVPGFSETFIPSSKDMFPITKLTFYTPRKIHKNDMKNITLICPVFLSEELNEIGPPSLELRKRKEEPVVPIGKNDILVPKLTANEIQNIKDKDICIIISNTYFEDKRIKNREKGSLRDVENLQDLLGKKYEIRLLENLTTRKLENHIFYILKEEIKDSHKTIIVFVLSHGSYGSFCTFNGGMSYDRLIGMFLRKSITILDKKLKYFFIVSCLSQKTCEKYQNVFVAFATSPGGKSKRNKHGSHFIRILIEVWKYNPSWKPEQVFELTKPIMEKKYGQIGFCINGITETVNDDNGTKRYAG